MVIKYRTCNGDIEAVEVLRATATMVVLPGKREVREAKRSARQNWHDTWEEAHAFILAEAQASVDSLRRRLERATDKLGNIKGMKKP